MKDIHNVTDFISNYVISEAPLIENELSSLTYRAGNQDASDDSSSVAEFAGCEISKTFIRLTRDNDLSVFYFPPCVYVNRCSGCCISQKMECVPTKTSMAEYKILKVRYSGPGSTTFKYEGHQFLQLEKHEKCSCQCIIKPEHCTARQIYLPDRCSCSCINEYQAANCPRPLKYWDSNQCRCRCRTEYTCSTTLRFDTDTCRCVVMRNTLIGIDSRRMTENTSNETSSNSILFPTD